MTKIVHDLSSYSAENLRSGLIDMVIDSNPMQQASGAVDFIARQYGYETVTTMANIDFQFYTSEKIVLRREIPQASAAVTNGQIHFERGKYIEEVSIKKNTPGTCEFVDHGVLHMSFENDNNKTFKFRIDPSGKFYYLLTFTGMHGEEYLRYDTIQYQVKKGDMTKLWVRKDQGYIFKATHRVIPGKTIDQ